MKTLLLIFVTTVTLQLNAQYDTLSFKSRSYNSYELAMMSDKNQVPYIVGSYDFPEYGVETRTCHVDESITLPNGRRIAGLSCIVLDKGSYIGGNLIFGKDTTTITNMTVSPDGEGAMFTVEGKDFSMSFNLVTGVILKHEENCAIFNTKNRGVWSIIKKG